MFWNIENIPGDRIALIDDNSGNIFTYERLLTESEKLTGVLKSEKKKLIFLFCDNSASCIIGYLAALRNGHAVYLANVKMDTELKQKLLNLYQPEIIISVKVIAGIAAGYTCLQNINGLFIYSGREANYVVHKELAVLLSTSGTTGSPKLVKLTYNNIQSNAESIAEYLSIDENERPATSLPVSYSFGLSVINSHLLKGASIFCTDKSMVMRIFWDSFSNNNCTSFSGVPFNFQMLRRLKFDRMKLPSLRTMTQAGGSLSEDFIKYFYDLAKDKNLRFFVMYGQTEATARISYVPFDKLGEKIGSIGIPIPGGDIKIYSENTEVQSPGVTGELIYYGPNVMMGYAESGTDLSKDDEYGGRLHTGDLGYKDEDGFAYITGRMKRFIKLFGLRINLDEVERMIENHFTVAAACCGTDDKMKILTQSDDEELPQKVKQQVLEIYNLHHSVVFIKNIKSLPVNNSGKRDYKAIQKMEI